MGYYNAAGLVLLSSNYKWFYDNWNHISPITTNRIIQSINENSKQKQVTGTKRPNQVTAGFSFSVDENENRFVIRQMTIRLEARERRLFES